MNKKNSLPPDFYNPFEGRDGQDEAEVWREIDQYLKPISREVLQRKVQAQRQAEEKRKDESTEKP